MGNKQCKGDCKFIEQARQNGSADYAAGEKRCNSCACVYPTDFIGKYCPCCGSILKYAKNPTAYEENHITLAGKLQTERRKLRRCSWCGSTISKKAAFRVVGNPKEVGSRIMFYQEWRSDWLGNTQCYDCYTIGLSLIAMDGRLEAFAKSINDMDIKIPDGFNERIKKILNLYKNTQTIQINQHQELVLPS